MEQPTYLDSELASTLQDEDAFPDTMLGHAQRMEAVGEAVHTAELPHVRAGFLMYAAVTRIVHDRMREFQYPDKIEETVPRFAQHAYNPLQSHVNGQRQDMTQLWQDLYYPGRELSTIGQLRKFWRSHIGIDLPVTLDQTDTQPHHKKDFFLVDDMLKQAAYEIQEQYLTQPDGRFRQFLGRAGLQVMLWEVYGSRRFAWSDGQRLLNAADEQQREQIVDMAGRRLRGTHDMSQVVVDFAMRRVGGYQIAEADGQAA